MKDLYIDLMNFYTIKFVYYFQILKLNSLPLVSLSLGTLQFVAVANRSRRWHGAWVELNLEGRAEFLGYTLVATPPCSPHFPQILDRDRTLAYAVIGDRPPELWRGRFCKRP